jgi:hypothetical protein
MKLRCEIRGWLARAISAPLLLLGAHASAQTPRLAWDAWYEGLEPGRNSADRVLAHPTGIYIAGVSGSSGALVLLRYGPHGQLLWERQFTSDDGVGPVVSDLVAHEAGGVLVAGYTRDSVGWRITILHYNHSGELVWERHRAVSGPALPDPGPQLAIAPDGTIHASATTGGDFLAIAYAPDGAPLWDTRLDLSGRSDYATDIAADGHGGVYLAGSIAEAAGFATVKLDGAGVHQWTHEDVDPLGGALGPAFIEVGRDGGIVTSAVAKSICGMSLSRTWKLASDGAPLWTVSFPPDPCESVHAMDVAMDKDSSVVILARSLRLDEPGGHNFALLKLDAAGVLLWSRFLDGAGDTDDTPRALALDGSGNIYLTGQAAATIYSSDAITASYTAGGMRRWIARYGSGVANSQPADIDLSPRGEVLVTGDSFDPGHDVAFFTIMYRQAPRLAPRP